jgi:hypothetical protein
MTSNRTKKTRFQPAVTGLENRWMADAKMVGALITPVGDAPVARPVPVEVAPLSMATQPRLAVAAQSATAGYQYTAITIINRSTATITYNFEWGNGAWKTITLKPGYEELHYIPGLNQTATIDFDKVYSPGYQDQRYRLTGNNVSFPAGYYLVQPTPSFSSGRAYTFQNVPGGVQLYS